MKNKVFTYKGFTGSVGVSFEDNCLYGKILFINDLVNYRADSPTELEQEFQAAVDDYLETCEECGLEPNKPFSGTFNVRIGPELHKKVALLSAQNDWKINQCVKEAITFFIKSQEINTVHHNHKHKYEHNFVFSFLDTLEQDEVENETCQVPKLRIVR